MATLSDVPQGPSSRLDADTLDGLQTSRAHAPAPNTLVAVDKNAKIPLSTGPGVSGTFISGDATPKTVTVVNGIITSIV